MNEAGLKIIIDAVAWIFAVGLLANGFFFAANLKLYTEIMKEKSQRNRTEGKVTK